ncbi:MAG: membrane protein insertion efficiency factor YidD [Planctomycetaceae bacterium]|nr:membrane protein insertion efficiency factor YidD [Planctomycetaceae bacterium]
MKTLLIFCVVIYKRCISPFLPHVCRFEPTCSTYMIEAVKKYGAVRGTWRSIKRLCRCHPFYRGNLNDPP